MGWLAAFWPLRGAAGERKRKGLRTEKSHADQFRTRVRLPPPPPFNLLKTKGEILDAGTVPGVSTKKRFL